MTSTKKYLGAVLAVVFTLGISPAYATPVLTWTGGDIVPPFSLQAIGGWEFALSSSITIDGLGFWDHNSDGLVGDHEVGLWNSDGSMLLASTTVTNASSTPEANGAGPGRWLFNDINDLTLGVGSYVIGAFFTPNNSDVAGVRSVATTIPELTFVNARQEQQPVGLEFPSLVIPQANAGVFGGNLRLKDAAVPVPTTLYLLGLGALGLGFSRRRRIA